ncbi:MAG TPA: ATP-binding protein [Oligoflexia bacterium]|nr:ATP-binding protein [Oligoflexia bacterium]
MGQFYLSPATLSPVEILLDLAHQLTLVARANEKELARIISNILNNAKEADATEVRISVKQSRDVVEVVISDNGRGIPAEVLAKLGSKGATFGKSGGTGLGFVPRH